MCWVWEVNVGQIKRKYLVIERIVMVRESEVSENRKECKVCAKLKIVIVGS